MGSTGIRGKYFENRCRNYFNYYVTGSCYLCFMGLFKLFGKSGQFRYGVSMADRKTIRKEIENFKQETIEQYLTIEQRAKVYCDEIPLSVSVYNPNIEHYCYEGIVKVATEATKELNKKLSQAEADYDKMFWQKNEIISNLQEQIEKIRVILCEYSCLDEKTKHYIDVVIKEIKEK